MGFLDRAKEAAQRATSQAKVAREQGQQRFSELQARREAETLLREVGLASYDEHRGKGTHEAVLRAVAKLEEHLHEHPLDLSTAGLRAYVRAAAGTEDAHTRDAERAGTDGSKDTEPADSERPPTEEPDTEPPTDETTESSDGKQTRE